MNLEFVCFFVALDASEAAKFEDWQLAYLDILHLVQFTHMMEIAHKLLQLFQMWYILGLPKDVTDGTNLLDCSMRKSGKICRTSLCQKRGVSQNAGEPN